MTKLDVERVLTKYGITDAHFTIHKNGQIEFKDVDVKEQEGWYRV